MPELPPVRREVLVPVDPETAFAIFTDRIGDWWPIGTGHSVHDAGSVAFEETELVETSAEGERTVWAEVLEWDPPAGFVLHWRPGRSVETGNRLTVSFDDHDDGTLVRLVHEGWSGYADPEEASQEYGAGWKRILALYASRVAAADPGAGWFVLQHTPRDGIGGALFRDERFRLHAEFLGRMRAAGRLLAAGPFGDEPVAGMTIIRVPEGRAEAARLATEDDLSVAQGLFDVHIRPWRLMMRGNESA